MDHFLQTFLNGLTTGALYCCIAIGFTLIFGIIQLIYFAQCEMAMLGAFSFAGAYSFFRPFLSTPSTIIISFLLAGILTTVATFLGQRFLLHPIRNAPKVKGLIVSLGYSIILQNIVLLTISPDALVFPLQNSQRWLVGSISITSAQLWIMAATILTWLAAWVLLYFTRLGRSIRAVAQSRKGALLMGISVEHVLTITFVLAAWTAVVAGIMMGFYNGQMRFDMGFIPGIKGFTAAILGGIGNIQGALLAGLLLGLAEGFFAGYLSSDYRDVFAFVLLIFILLIRPHGLLGEGS